jgi:hypothetical protein
MLKIMHNALKSAAQNYFFAEFTGIIRNDGEFLVPYLVRQVSTFSLSEKALFF